MKFIVSSNQLLKQLQILGGVINKQDLRLQLEDLGSIPW